MHRSSPKQKTRSLVVVEGTKTIRCLVAEDEIGMKKSIIKNFSTVQTQLDEKKSNINLTLEFAVSGPSAVRRHLATAYDLILMDYVMPGGNGATAILGILEENPKAIICIHSNTAHDTIKETLQKSKCDHPQWKDIDISRVDFTSLSKVCKKSEICDVVVKQLKRPIEKILSVVINANADELDNEKKRQQGELKELTDRVAIVEYIADYFKSAEKHLQTSQELAPVVPDSPASLTLNVPQEDTPSPSSVSPRKDSAPPTPIGSESNTPTEGGQRTFRGELRRAQARAAKVATPTLPPAPPLHVTVDAATQTEARTVTVDAETQTEALISGSQAHVSSRLFTPVVEKQVSKISKGTEKCASKTSIESVPVEIQPRGRWFQCC